MKPTQSPPPSTSSTTAGPNTSSIPEDSSNKVFVTHHSVKFVIVTENNNELIKVKCSGREHLIDQVWQCSQYGHLMCRKCCFPSQETPPEICPTHQTPVFCDNSVGRSICSTQVACPANETFNATCPWSGEYTTVTKHLDDCIFIPGSARVTMQNAMLKAAEQKYEELKQEAASQSHRIQQDSDQRYKALKQVSDQICRNLTQKHDELANLLKNLPPQLAGQSVNITRPAPAPATTAASIIDERRPLSFNGKLTWPITKFSSKLNLAKQNRNYCLYSPPFYTSESGYKVRVRLFPNGDGMGMGKCVSIFFQIMEGPYDGMLEWPFNKKVSFRILDHDGKEQFFDGFRPNVACNSFQRPQRGPNSSVGCPLFVDLKDLENHPCLRGDTLFVNVIVGQN